MLNSKSLVKFLILSAGLVICSKIYYFWSQKLTCSDNMWKFEKNNKLIKRIDILFLLYMSVIYKFKLHECISTSRLATSCFILIGYVA
jgi:hypothetical protein